MTTYKVLLFNAIVITLFHYNTALFYTSSRERDYPRIGKRYLNVAGVLKTPNWYPLSRVNVYKGLSKQEPAVKMDDDKWRPVLYSGQEFDSVADEILQDDKEVPRKIQQLNDVFRDHIRRLQRQQFEPLENGHLPPEY